MLQLLDNSFLYHLRYKLLLQQKLGLVFCPYLPPILPVPFRLLFHRIFLRTEIIVAAVLGQHELFVIFEVFETFGVVEVVDHFPELVGNLSEGDQNALDEIDVFFLLLPKDVPLLI